jgi:transcriptional regulator with XRE-family HTH domain
MPPVVKVTALQLRERRLRLGLSVAELARHFYVLPQAIYRWERGDGPPKGLTSIGADTVLRRLEAAHRAGRSLD